MLALVDWVVSSSLGLPEPDFSGESHQVLESLDFQK
jgi:hypothetical protein